MVSLKKTTALDSVGSKTGVIRTSAGMHIVAIMCIVSLSTFKSEVTPSTKTRSSSYASGTVMSHDKVLCSYVSCLGLCLVFHRDATAAETS